MNLKQSRSELENRRRLAVTRVLEGYSQAKVARFLGVSPRAVRSWVAAYRRHGDDGLAARSAPGAPPKLTPDQEFEVLMWIVCYQPTSFGFTTDLWTSRRLAHLIEQRFGVRFNANYLCDWLRQRNLSPQKPRRRPKERDDKKIARWLAEDWPVLQQKVEAGAHLVWIDEAGFLLAPLLRRTWAPRGQRPVSEQRASHRDKVSALAALTLSPIRGQPGLYFQTYPGEYIANADVALFLRQLLRHLRGQVVLLCDQGTMHKGDPIWAVIGDYASRLTMAYLPPYAPDLNPVEWLWSWLKYSRLANYTAPGVAELDEAARRELGAALRSPQLLHSFFQGSSFPLPQKQTNRNQAA